jgi:UDP-N-acetyl-D-mannosaminuronate dehydrogenase
VIEGTTLVIGLGEVGSALAEVLERSQRILRHDIEPVKIEEPIGVAHLCFPSQSREQFERIAIGYLERFLPKLAIINSTVLPGTTRRIAAATKIPTAYSPVRGKHAHMADDLVRYRKFVSAVDVDTARMAEQHFERGGIQTRRTNRIETLELAKLAETTYFGILIAYAQELNRYCEKVDGDYYEATNFFDEIDFLPRVRYFPGFIGGHCVVPNINLMLQLGESAMLQAVLDSNRKRAEEIDKQPPAPKQAVRSASNLGGNGKVLADR